MTSNRIRKTARINGRQLEASGRTEREAWERLQEKINAEKRGVLSGDMTLDAWFETWVATYKSPKGLTAKSLAMYRQKYEGYIHPRIGFLPLQAVKTIQLQAILNDEAGKSASHLKKLRMVMRELFRYARLSRLIEFDPSELLELPFSTKGTRRSITDEERAAILEVAEYHKAGPWVRMLLFTGMRPGETAALTWGDINLDSREIYVRAAKESGAKRVKKPKTNAGIRTIPIRETYLPYLLEAAKGGHETSELVFSNTKGEMHTEDSLRRLWKSFVRELDLHMGAVTYRNKIVVSKVAPDLVPYCLRHTFCTDMEKAGIPLNVAKEIMGHADVSTTANIYTHADTANLHINIGLMDIPSQDALTQQSPSSKMQKSAYF